MTLSISSRVRAGGLLLGGLLLVPRSGMAQSNYRDTPIGGRSATMGGAATAAGNDSAMPYLNPAGLASIPGDVLALSAQVYSYSRWKVDRFFSPDGYGFATENPTETFSASRVAQLPSSVMYMKHFGAPDASMRGVLAMSLITPSNQSISFTGSASVDRPEVNGGLAQSGNIEYTNSDTYVGPSAAIALGKRLNAGLSLFYLYSSRRLIVQQTSFVYDFGGARTQESSESDTLDQTVHSLVPVLGVQLDVGGGLKVGLGAAAPSIRIDGRNDRAEHYKTSGKTNEKDDTLFTGKAFAQRPLRLNAGVAFERPRSFGVAADATFHTSASNFYGYKGTQKVIATSEDDVTRNYNERQERQHDAKAVLNLAFGAEVWVLPSLAVRLGAFTNRAPIDVDGGEPYTLSLDRMGVTAGLGLEAGSFETTVGVIYQRGSGSLLAPDFTSRAAIQEGTRFVPVGVTEDSLMFVLSGVVTTEEAKDSINKQTKGSVPGGLP